MSDWQKQTLGELTVNYDGKRRPVKEADRKTGPNPYYGASGIVGYVDGYLFDGDYLLIAEDGENLRTRQTPIAFMAKGKFWVNNHAHIVTANEKADTRFLMYALHIADVDAFLTGAVMPKLTQGNLNLIPIFYPPVNIQRTIAHVLGTIDDKIELNRRINKTLEAMARAIFKSWFVDFDPVRAKMSGEPPESICRRLGLTSDLLDLFPDRLQGSELGEIPEGWKIKTIEKEFDIQMGQSPPGETYNTQNEGLPFYQGRTDFGFRFPTQRIFCVAPKRIANVDDTLISVRAPVGDINMAAEVCCIGRGVAAARHKSGSRSFTYYFMLAMQDRFRQFEGEGTVFGSIGKKDFYSIRRIAPPGQIVNSFEWYAAPIDDKIAYNALECCSLTLLRDTLLPNLLSGELRLLDAKKFVAEAIK